MFGCAVPWTSASAATKAGAVPGRPARVAVRTDAAKAVTAVADVGAADAAGPPAAVDPVFPSSRLRCDGRSSRAPGSAIVHPASTPMVWRELNVSSSP